jgi:tetratricopeptide (TPR) repeat protein
MVGTPVAAFDTAVYAQPLDTVAAPTVVVEAQADGQPAAAPLAGPAADFEAARAAFRVGQYAEALRSTEAAIAVQTQDAALHEFRALCLFALGRYDEAAATLYAVLAVGPGWDWPTLIGLYPSVDVYTAQLRRLEDACVAQADAAAPRFVLAYHYLTAGHRDAAARILRKVVALQPKDTLSAGLLAKLEAPAAGAPAAAAGAPALAAPAAPAGDAPAPAAAVPAAGPADAGPQFPLAGTWKAQPNAETTITLSVQVDGSFTWDVTKNGQTRRMAGTSTVGKTGLLTLAGGAADGALVGQLRWADADHVRLSLLGAQAKESGLEFTRVP